MTINVREVERDQLFLMPPSVADWLPENHLAWFVLDVVDELDLSGFFASHRDDGRGGASYHPSLMLAVLLYAYCTGDRSSRRIDRRLIEDVAYRVLAANQAPDHATIARFRRRHEEAIAELFDQVLGLCATAGIIDNSLVAIDGTKIAVNASPAANRTRRQIVEEILAEAERQDAEEDRALGDRRGDELPAAWSDRRDRRSRIAEALRQLDSDGRGREQPEEVESESTSRRQHAPWSKQSLSNTTDPDSRSMPTTGRVAHRFLQGYNAQAAATPDQVIVAAEVTQETNDLHQLAPLVEATTNNLRAAGLDSPVRAFVADAGYWSMANAAITTDSELLIATSSRARSVDPDDPGLRERQALVERVARGELSARAAGKELGVSGVRFAKLVRMHRGELPDPARARREMDAKLSEEHNAKRYAKRKQMIEPVFGNIKANLGYRRFTRRGLGAVESEWRLICAAHNLMKLRRLSPRPI